MDDELVTKVGRNFKITIDSDHNLRIKIPLDVSPPRGPIVDISEPPLDPFWTKVWFKYGLPTGLGVTASLLEIWRALS